MRLKYYFRNTITLIVRSYLYLFIIIIGAMVWFNFENYWVIFLTIIYLVNILPGLYLHFEYLKANHDVEFYIDNNHIKVSNEKFEKIYSKDDLQRIIVYMCPSVFKKSHFRSFAVEDYYYARVITKDGEELIITCLLTSKIEEALMQLKGVEYIRRKELFCTLSLKYRG